MANLWDYTSTILARLPGDVWSIFEPTGVLRTALCWVITYQISKWRNRTQQMKKMRLELKNVAIATLISLGIVFLFMVLIYSPFRQVKESLDEVTKKATLVAIKDDLIKDLQTKIDELSKPNFKASIEAINVYGKRNFQILLELFL